MTIITRSRTQKNLASGAENLSTRPKEKSVAPQHIEKKEAEPSILKSSRTETEEAMKSLPLVQPKFQSKENEVKETAPTRNGTTQNAAEGKRKSLPTSPKMPKTDITEPIQRDRANISHPSKKRHNHSNNKPNKEPRAESLQQRQPFGRPMSVNPVRNFEEAQRRASSAVQVPIDKDGETPHHLEYCYTASKADNASKLELSIQNLQLLSATYRSKESHQLSFDTKIVFSRRVHAYSIEVLVLKHSSEIYDLLFVNSRGVALLRTLLSEDDVIAFDAKSTDSPQKEYIRGKSCETCTNCLRVVYATQRGVYILDFPDDYMRELTTTILAQVTPPTGSRQVLQGYFRRTPSLSHGFAVSIVSNALRFVAHAQTILVGTTDGSFYFFRVDSATFAPVYYTNIFQRDMLENSSKDAFSTIMSVRNFFLSNQILSSVEIRTCAKRSERLLSKGIIDIDYPVNDVSSVISVVADQNLLLLVVGIHGEMLFDHYEPTGMKIKKAIPFFARLAENDTDSLCLLRIDGATLCIQHCALGSLVKLFQCRVLQSEDLTTDFIDVAEWMNTDQFCRLQQTVDNEERSGYLSLDSAGIVSIDLQVSQYRAKSIPTKSTLSLQQVNRILRDALSIAFPPIHVSKDPQESMICTMNGILSNSLTFLRLGH